MTTVLAPLAGVLQELSESPDPVFSSQLLGAGVGIIPTLTAETIVVSSPVSGTVEACFPHAFVVSGILVHLGIDSKAANTFHPLHHQRNSVEAGQPMIRWDVASHQRQGLPLWTGLIALDRFQVRLEVPTGEAVTPGQPVLSF